MGISQKLPAVAETESIVLKRIDTGRPSSLLHAIPTHVALSHVRHGLIEAT